MYPWSHLNISMPGDFILLLALSSTLVHAGSVALGEPCSLSRIHLDPQTHRLITDCDPTTFCYPATGNNTASGGMANIDGVCQSKGCRRAAFPFGYDIDEGVPLPPLCTYEKFCPDDESGCMPLVAPGGYCEFGRDDQCALNRSSGTSSAIYASDWALYFAPSVRCLNMTCT
jgi:hypothetical protein